MNIDASCGVRAQPDDAKAMRLARDRPEAFATVFDRHYRAVHSYLARAQLRRVLTEENVHG